MISLAASQSALAARADVVPARLFHLTTYADRERGTIDREFWWSLGAPWWYEWGGGAAREFDDLVRSCAPIEYAIGHLPAPTRADTRRGAVRLELSNEDVDGQPLWKTLFADPLVFARLEIASLLIEPERLVPNTAWWDLRDLVGTEHVVRFRGEFTGVDEVSDDGIVMLFEGEEPNVDWPEALDDTQVDAKDLGRRYAIPFGNAKAVPCVNRNVGWVTTLAAAISPSYTGNADVTNAVGFPASGSFTLQIGGERVTASKVDPDTVNISARGLGGTISTSHQAGESILEVQASVVIVAGGVPCKAVDALYVINPATREKVKVPSSLYTVDLDDRDVDPGRRLTTATLSQAQLEDLIDSLAASQGDPYEEVLLNRFLAEAKSSEYAATVDCDAVLGQETSGIRLNGSVGTSEQATWTLDAAAIPTGLLNRPITRFRAKCKLNGEGDTTNGGGGTSNAKTRFRFYVHSTTTWAAGPLEITEPTDYSFETGSQESGVEVASAWLTPATQKYGSDLDEIELFFTILDTQGDGYGSDNWVFVFADSVRLEVEFGPAPISSLGAAAFGWGLQFVADVQGVTVPFSFTAGYGFDEGTGWSLANATQSDQSGVQRITSAAPALITDAAGAADSTALYATTTATLTQDTGDKTEGTGSILITPTASGSVARARRSPMSATEDWSDVVIALDVKVAGASHLSATDGVRVAIFSSSGNFKEWNFGTNDGLAADGAWHTIFLDVSGTPDASVGTLIQTAVNEFWITCNALTNSASNTCKFDNIRKLPQTAIAQRNATAAAIDLTASGARYRARFRVANANRLASLVVRFSNTAGTGTTLPAAYRTVTISGAEISEGEWLDVEKIATDTGSPGVSSIETVRVELIHNGLGIELPSVDFDAIGGAEATNAAWDGATPGTLLTAGPDALRWFIGELAKVGAANVLGVATAKTNLGSAAFAGNLCALGTDFATVVARLAFETRTNVVRKEGASSAQFQLLNASTAYAFPASSTTLEEMRELRERGRGAQEIATHFRFHFSVELADAQFATNEAAFRALLRADPSVSDLAAPTTSQLGAVAAVLGRRDAPPIFFLMAQDEASAKDVAGYYASELIRYAARRWSLIAPLWEAYALEPGDVVAFTPRWAAGAVKARVLGTTVDLADPSIGLSLEEVN